MSFRAAIPWRLLSGSVHFKCRGFRFGDAMKIFDQYAATDNFANARVSAKGFTPRLAVSLKNFCLAKRLNPFVCNTTIVR